MNFSVRYFVLPGLALALSSTSTLALTAEEVWTSWKELSAEFGVEVNTKSEAKNGSDLVISGATFAVGSGDDSAEVNFDSLTFSEESDGSVSIVPSATASSKVVDGKDEITGALSFEGTQFVVAEGEEGGLVYEVSADALALAYEGTIAGVEGMGEEPTTIAGMITLAKLSGAYADDAQPLRSLSMELAIESMEQTSSQKSPMLGENSTEGTSQGIEFAASLVIPEDLDSIDTDSYAGMAKALESGLEMSLGLSQKSATSKTTMTGMLPLEIAAVAGEAGLSFEFNKETMALGAHFEGIELEGASEMLPVPVLVKLAGIGVSMAMPMNAVNEPGPYELKFALDNLSVNDEVWDMFDPAKSLVRGPASLGLDIAGLMSGAVSDAAKGIDGSDDWEPTIESVKINGISAEVAGATLNATGEFELDNSGPMVSPIGEAHVTATGIDNLLGGLQAVGLISEDDAAGAAMMVQMFMVAGDEPDTMVSHIEAKEGDQIFVNGQQLQ